MPRFERPHEGDTFTFKLKITAPDVEMFAAVSDDTISLTVRITHKSHGTRTLAVGVAANVHATAANVGD